MSEMRCTVCGESKPKEAFAKGRRQCKRCRLDIKKAKYDPAKQKEINDRRAWAARAWRYGVSEEELRELWDVQEHRCCICKRMTRRPSVDHDHRTDEVRGLLCQRCNILLGQADDSVDLLLAAIEYLQRSENDVCYADESVVAQRAA